MFRDTFWRRKADASVVILARKIRFGAKPSSCVAHFWTEDLGYSWLVEHGSHASVSAAGEAGKFVSWLLLWGGRVCKVRPFLNIERVIQKAWAARKHDQGLYMGLCPVLGMKPWARQTVVPACKVFILVCLHTWLLMAKKGNSLKWFNLYYEMRTYTDYPII